MTGRNDDFTSDLERRSHSVRAVLAATAENVRNLPTEGLITIIATTDNNYYFNISELPADRVVFLLEALKLRVLLDNHHHSATPDQT